MFLMLATIVLLVGYGIICWFLFRDGTVVRPRKPSEFEVAAQKFADAMQELSRAFAAALIPATEDAVRALNKLSKALKDRSE